ncbi:peptide deformylase [Xanthovirga aplysinae]|uniref:peptide deformylase n=1 Tax=Xanthovirga aplysinae TaxID=2529853 RepID=UPI0012BCC823|nr:peptide deformylase [Xanthovirga aplysinae]MTI31646.1 peptide deformylase [Xanthovirga aplysinae]
MIYPIVAYGDPVLRKEAQDIEKDSIDVKQLSQDMFETMHEANGVGLAAPQIGKSIRLFVVEVELEEEDQEPFHFKRVFVNAEIIEEDGEDWPFEEGCLSIPNIREEVMRPEKLKIRYFDENWKEYEEEYDGMIARVIQHEYDHIDGILFTDYLSGLKKRLLKGKLANISKGKVDVDYRMKFPLKK